MTEHSEDDLLLPCPFCGGKAIDCSSYIECSKCFSNWSHTIGNTRAMPVQSLNTSPSSVQNQEEIERVADSLGCHIYKSPAELKHLARVAIAAMPRPELTEEEWKELATQKSLDIVESFYNILKERDKEIVRKDKALLFAQRWFKLNFDDQTLQEHPPSKADLAGMHDAMQDARMLLPAMGDQKIDDICKCECNSYIRHIYGPHELRCTQCGGKVVANPVENEEQRREG